MKTTWRNQEKAKGKMEEKKYLKWYNKVGYGSGDMAGNVVYSFLSSFIMIYLTNIVGLNADIKEQESIILFVYDDIKVFEKSRTYKVELKELTKEKK